MDVNAAINAGSPPSGLQITQRFAMLVVCCSGVLAEQALQQLRFIIVSVLLILDSRHYTTFAYSSWRTMTRIRGRSRRGAPWKPRRPSISRSASSSLDSSSRSHHSRSNSGHFSSTSLHLEQDHSLAWALVPYAVTHPPRPPGDPPIHPPHPEPDLHQSFRGAGPLPRDAATPEQTWESLAALYDLAFGIRQGVDDLNFRLQETDFKVDTFLNTLASLQDSLLHRQHEDSPAQGPSATQEEDDDATRGKAMDVDVDAGATSGSKAVNTMGAGEGDENWGDQVTYIEEEPWTEDFQPKWPEYSPYV
jgi:hypothetical protein